MRSFYTKIVVAVATAWYGGMVILADLLGGRRTPDSFIEQAPSRWARAIGRAAGMKIVVHGLDDFDTSVPHVYVANHVSVMDIPAVITALPDHGFVAKRELSSIPIFGKAARAVGVVFIDRENRKSAFTAYEAAAEKVKAGRSVIVFPEGTRGNSYALRQFKKGPFVLAISAGVPVVPVILHGTIEVTPNGTTHVTPGTVHVHALEPIPTSHLAYDDRDELADLVRLRMAEAMHSLYGVHSPASEQSAPLESYLDYSSTSL